MIVVTIVVRRSAGAKSAAMLGRFSVPGALLLLPDRRLRQEWPDQDQRDRGDDARHQRVTPRRVGILHDDAERGNRRQAQRVLDGEPVDGGDEQPAERGERLRVAEHLLALFRLGEQFSEPGDSGHELDADADEHEAAQHEQHLESTSRTLRGTRRTRR